MISFDIPATPPSLNKFYAGMHWRKRKEIADLWHLLVMSEVRKLKIKSINKPISITTRPRFKTNRRRDCDNYSTATKLIADGLVKAKIIVDDSAEYVIQTTQQAPYCDKGKPEVTHVDIFIWDEVKR